MAGVSIEGFDEIERALLRQDSKAIERVPVMLEAAAQIIVKAHKEYIRKYDLIDTEKMLQSTKPTKVKSTKAGSHCIYVYPQGTVTRKSKKLKDGNTSESKVRNAEKAFIAEFGKSNQPGTRWMAQANEACVEEANAAMMKIWEEEY